MIPAKTFIRFLLVILAILTGLFLFTQSTKPLAPTVKNDVTTSQQTSQGRLVYPHNRFKAAFYTFVKDDSGSLTKLRHTIRSLEDQFNKDRNYPYVIFTDQKLSKDFTTLASSLTKAPVYFEKVSKDLYGYPPNTDMKKAAQARLDLNGTMFGDSEDYRFQSRFMAGTIYRHPVMQELDYGWRFEAGTEYVCPMDEDPFQTMFETKKTTSFSIALYEYPDTIPTLYDNVVKYALEYKEIVQQKENPKALWNFIWEPNSETFNRCHFWNNFQIADISFYRGEKYQNFFNYLEQANGIFYERWGDPIIQSLAATLFLTRDDIHFWDNIGYRVANFFTHCPSEKSLYSRCTCRPDQNFDFNGYSCLRFFLDSEL